MMGGWMCLNSFSLILERFRHLSSAPRTLCSLLFRIHTAYVRQTDCCAHYSASARSICVCALAVRSSTQITDGHESPERIPRCTRRDRAPLSLS